MIRPSCCSNPQASTHHNTTKQLAHRCSRGAPAAVRRRLPIVAFRPARAPAQTLVEQEDGAPTALLPLDFYACLAVTRTAGGRAVRDALGRALLKRPEAYYSSDTVALRDLLLRGAAECLLDYDRRRGSRGKGHTRSTLHLMCTIQLTCLQGVVHKQVSSHC